VVFIAPGISEGALDAISDFAIGRKDQLQLLVMATEAGGPVPGGGFSNLDRTALEGFARATGAVVTLFTIDGSDVERVQRRTQRHLASVQLEDSEGRWRDEGWWLSWPIAAMVLLWFRRGWTIQWEA
jgi:Ca-activated chloride channel family protein